MAPGIKRDVWKHYIVTESNGKRSATCKNCGKRYGNANVTRLGLHLSSCLDVDVPGDATDCDNNLDCDTNMPEAPTVQNNSTATVSSMMPTATVKSRPQPQPLKSLLDEMKTGK